MRRRALLRLIAAGGTAPAAGGCLDRDPARGTAESTDSPTATPRSVDGTPEAGTSTPTSGVPRRVHLDDVDDGDLRSVLDVAASATVVEPRVTPERTARVDVTLEPRGDADRALTYEAEECDLNAIEGVRADGDARLLLAPADADWTPTSGACWRADRRNVSCGIPVTTREIDLPADGSVTWRFALWATPTGPCMPSGRYEFERTFDGGAAALALTLRLTVPDS